MGRRSRRRGHEALAAPTADYTDVDGNVLTLRGSMSPATRRRYAQTVAGSPLSQEDAWHRAVELLFEHLAVRWTVAGLPIERQAELLGRCAWPPRPSAPGCATSLRAHVAEHFPDVTAP